LEEAEIITDRIAPMILPDYGNSKNPRTLVDCPLFRNDKIIVSRFFLPPGRIRRDPFDRMEGVSNQTPKLRRQALPGIIRRSLRCRKDDYPDAFPHVNRISAHTGK
jgi:hypothetical protein